MSFAPPVSRDGFHYNGDLYVEVGNLNRHKRASIAEITSILRPDLKNTASAQAPKDQVGHWYEAQLIHYGLPPSKDKARAKMRLLEALNGSKLAVPKAVTKLEADLKKEYTAADRKAKAEYKAQMGATPIKESTAGKKRKQSDMVNNVNVNISFGPQGQVMVNGGDSEKPPPAKKAKAAAPKSTAKKDQGEAKEDRKNWPKQTARRSTGGFPVGQRSSGIAESSDEEDKPKRNMARRSGGSFPIGQRSSIPQTSSPERPRPKQTARRSGGFVPIGQRPGAAASSPKKEPGVKRESKVKQESSSQDLPKLGLLNGHYDIECPTIEGEWPDWANDLSLTLTLDTPGLWGAYDFGMFSGIFHIENRPYESSDESVPCRWRGRENGEGQMSFGNQCTGAINFLGGGRIEGWLSLYGRCEFYGTRRPGPGNAPRTASSMRQEWDGYNEDEYEAANRRRWGGW